MIVLVLVHVCIVLVLVIITHTLSCMMYVCVQEPINQPTAFTVKAAGGTGGAGSGWKLCNVRTLQSVAAAADGSASWQSKSEAGSWLIFSATTPCHKPPPPLDQLDS